ncbi:MAG: polysaccharide lyase [Bacteroidota bacterium]
MKRRTIVILLLLAISSVILIAFFETHLAGFNNKRIVADRENNIFDVIWAADFQDQEPGVFNFRDVKREYGSSGIQFGRDMSGIGILHFRQPGIENDENIIIEVEKENRFTRNWFKGGHYGIIDEDNPIGSGHLFHPKIPGKHAEVWISHNIRWPRDRDWALSGNMGVSVSGGSSPHGCKPYQEGNHNGFILNLMWSKQREMKLYMYWPGKDDSIAPCGNSGPFKWFDPNTPEKNLIVTDYAGEWHNIALRVVLNDNYIPGKGNGMIEAFWDGELAFRVDTLRLRTEPGVYIDHARSQFNHGGNDDRFAPDRDTYIDVDDVWTWTWKEGSGLPTGITPWDKEKKVPLPNYPKSGNS